jgi:hypothetical protein
LGEEFVEFDKASEIFFEQVEFVELFAGLLEFMLGFFEASSITVCFGEAFAIAGLALGGFG